MEQLQNGNNKCILIIDGGTSNTRFTILNDGKVLKRLTINLGVKSSGDYAKKLKDAIESTGYHFSAIFASGMITSKNGLKEIPYMIAPVTFENLLAHVKPYDGLLPAIDTPFYFVPGICFHQDGDFCKKDIMRGEETEIFGALTESDLDKTILFIHFGSHNKAILYKNQAITESVTTLSGELLSAVCENTILKNSVGDLSLKNVSDIVENFVLQGFQACRDNGLTRTLFLSRISHILDGNTHDQVFSFILGAIIFSDVEAFSSLLKEKVDKIVLYGRDSFSMAMHICLKEHFENLADRVTIIDFKNSEELSLKCMITICAKMLF